MAEAGQLWPIAVFPKANRHFHSLLFLTFNIPNYLPPQGQRSELGFCILSSSRSAQTGPCGRPKVPDLLSQISAYGSELHQHYTWVPTEVALLRTSGPIRALEFFFLKKKKCRSAAHLGNITKTPFFLGTVENCKGTRHNKKKKISFSNPNSSRKPNWSPSIFPRSQSSGPLGRGRGSASVMVRCYPNHRVNIMCNDKMPVPRATVHSLPLQPSRANMSL